MEKITIEIETRNSAFKEDFYNETHEVARILRELADRLENGSEPKKLMDINGNSVGSVEYE